MKQRWAPGYTKGSPKGFTIIELIIVIVVIAILVAISILAYTGIQKNASERAAQSDLQHVASEMQRAAQNNGGAYPTTLPSTINASKGITLTLKRSGNANFYTPLTAVQNGVLFAQICQNLIDEGAGKGLNKGGDTEDYLTGCGNWNYNSTQIGGWTPKKFTTPVTESNLITYADNFTNTDTYNKAEITTVKAFYRQLIERLKDQGGSFPVTSFWDYWSTPASGGVALQPLGTPQLRPAYCVEATHSQYSTISWHITDKLRLEPYGC